MSSENLRIALVHHWLVATRGGERVFEALAGLFPDADVYTLICDKSKMPESLRVRSIHTSILSRLPRAARWYPYYLPLFPIAAQRLDLTRYDLVISSDAATVKGVRTGRGTHVCYCHTPMRYVWHGYEAYMRAAGPFARHGLRAVRRSLCRWDYSAAQKVTRFVANSRHVQARISESYGRSSVVIYPPVDTERFASPTRVRFEDDSFLLVSHLVPYKRIDAIIDAFNASGRPLNVIGDGPERGRLENKAGPGIRFLGSQPDEVVVAAMRECRAFVFAGEEDFGIVMAEAQASGKPVIALGRGGATEIVRDGVTGILFPEASVEAIEGALHRFDRMAFDPVRLRAAASRFGRERFGREFLSLIQDTLRQNAGSDIGPGHGRRPAGRLPVLTETRSPGPRPAS
jgi:glycosyltransferase involved in cell wall biosynthesis